MSEKEEQRNQERDINYVKHIGETILPYTIAAFLLGIMFYFMRLVGT